METPVTNLEEDFNDSESIFTLTPFPMWIFDLESLKFLTVNYEAVRQYGYSRAEFLSMTIEEIRPVEDIPKLEKAIEQVRIRTHSFKESLYRHQKKDGGIIVVQIKGNLITYKGRKAEIITAIDLTERHQEQKRIEEQKESLRTIEKINDTLLKTGDWISALDQCFEIIGETLKIDRIYFFQNDLKQETSSQRLEWTRNLIDSEIDNPKMQNVPFSEFPIFMEPLRSGKNFEAVVSELPSSPTKQILQEQGVKTIFVAPVMSHDTFMGFIGMDDCTLERKWAIEESQIIKSLTTNLAHVIARKIIQTELINNEYKFRTIVQKSSDLVAILNEEGVFQYVNHSSIEVIGISPEDFLGKHVNDYLHPEDVPKVEKGLFEILQKNIVAIPPFRFPDAKGKYRWLKTTLTNFLDDPVISGIVANSREVTSEVERQMEKELLDSISKDIGQPASLKECLNQALFELLKLPGICLAEAWIKSQDESRLDLRAFRYNTLEPESFYTLSPEDSMLFGNGLPGYIWKNKKVVLWGDLSEHQSFNRKGFAKMTGLQAAIGIPIIYNEEFLGSFLLFSQQSKSTLVDIEKLLQDTGDKLGASVKQKIIEDEYRNFFEISPDPHCIIGFDGHLKKSNRALSQLLGYEESALLNRHISSVIHEEDKEKVFQKIKSSIANEASGSFTIRFKTIDGQTKWLIWSGTVIPDAKIFMAVAKDITDQKLAEQELKRTFNRLKNAQKISSLGYWTKKFDSDDLEWSEETYKIFGYTPETFIPTMENVTRAYHPDDRYLIEADPKKALIGSAYRRGNQFICDGNQSRFYLQRY